MIDKLERIAVRQKEILNELASPEVQGDSKRMQKLLKEQAELIPFAEVYDQYRQVEETIRDCTELMDTESDEGMRAMLKEELLNAEQEETDLIEQIRIMLLPKDPDDDKNVILEIRAGAGGDEAALFAAELYRMYSRYAAAKGWKVELLSFNENGLGGFKECIASITGQNVYARLKFESGTHRVQRIPVTESNGKIQTSTCTVAIMPEVEDVEVEIDPNDLRFDVFRASGNGGQCVNTTDSAVRLTHIPTGIVISCQDEKSQLKNRAKALKVLRAKLYDLEKQKMHEERAELRKNQVGTGERSEKIRTYHFGQGRVTDHRIHLTLHKIDSIMNGELDELIDALTAEERAGQLAAQEK